MGLFQLDHKQTLEILLGMVVNSSSSSSNSILLVLSKLKKAIITNLICPLIYKSSKYLICTHICLPNWWCRIPTTITISHSVHKVFTQVAWLRHHSRKISSRGGLKEDYHHHRLLDLKGLHIEKILLRWISFSSHNSTIHIKNQWVLRIYIIFQGILTHLVILT